MTGKKTAKKTAKRRTKKTPKKTTKRKGVVRGRPFTGKKDPRNGRGKKGRSGRIPNELKLECQDAVFSFGLRKIINYVKAPKKNPSDSGFRWAVDTLLERGFGKVPQPVTGDSEGDPIGVRVEQETTLRNEFLERLALIAKRTPKRK